MPGDLFSKQRGEQIIANHGNMTRRADGQHVERTALTQTHTRASELWCSCKQVKSGLFVQTRYHIQCLKGLCRPTTATALDSDSPNFSKEDKENPSQKTWRITKHKKRRGRARVGKFKESSFLCGQHGVNSSRRRGKGNNKESCNSRKRKSVIIN